MDSVSIYRLKEILLQSGQLLPDVELVYKTYGTLNRNKDNVVLFFN